MVEVAPCAARAEGEEDEGATWMRGPSRACDAALLRGKGCVEEWGGCLTLGAWMVESRDRDLSRPWP